MLHSGFFFRFQLSLEGEDKTFCEAWAHFLQATEPLNR
jgi:hypothetical protein